MALIKNILLNSLRLIVFLISLLGLSTAIAFANSIKNEEVSLDFEDIPVREVLSVLAKLGNINIVVNDSVKGNMTLHINKVYWKDALMIILKSRGLDARKVHGVLLIGLVDEMLTLDKTSEETENLVITTVPIHHAKAEEIAKTIQTAKETFLSPRGRVSFDRRTNALILQETQDKTVRVHKLVQSIDVPVKQILIEARIVTINRDYEKDLGIRFETTEEENSSDSTGSLHIDLAALSTSTTSPASMGVALAKLGNGTLLDLELSALESEGEGKVISSPRLITADQQSAFIESGEEIPYQESTSSGATAVIFKKAVLRLKVTPHILDKNNVMMALVINQDIPNAILINGVPEVSTKEIQTQVSVHNGQTLVLGGIYRQDKTHSVERVPFLSDIPGIGSIFQQKRDKITYEELLIFITPKIVEEEM